MQFAKALLPLFALVLAATGVVAEVNVGITSVLLRMDLKCTRTFYF